MIWYDKSNQYQPLVCKMWACKWHSGILQDGWMHFLGVGEPVLHKPMGATKSLSCKKEKNTCNVRVHWQFQTEYPVFPAAMLVRRMLIVMGLSTLISVVDWLLLHCHTHQCCTTWFWPPGPSWPWKHRLQSFWPGCMSSPCTEEGLRLS